MNMIDQAKRKRVELEEAIKKLIQEFEKETSLSVVEINREDSCLLIKDIEIKVALPRHMSKEYCEEQEKEWERKIKEREDSKSNL